MIERKFELKQSLPERHNEDLPDDQGFTLQTTTLTSEDGFDIAAIDAYLDDGYYCIYWPTMKPENELVQLVENCIKQYEEKFAEGIPNLQNKQTDPFGGGLQIDNKYDKGIIMYVKGSGNAERLGLDYERPLSWDQILKAAEGREVTLARFNTPVGDFCIEKHDKAPLFGVISHLKETTGFADLLVKSASESVTTEQANRLLDKAIAAFPIELQSD